MKKLNELTLKLFSVIVIGVEKLLDFKAINELATRHGYLVTPFACTQSVHHFLSSKNIDYNSTFYKEWNDITTKSRWELLMDQIKHYQSTYGTGFQGKPWLANDGDRSAVPVVNFSSYKIIEAVDSADIITKCEKMLASGIALKEETINDILDIFALLKHQIDINIVKNKEAKMFLHQVKGILPTDPVEMVRYLVYLATGKTMVIQNKQMIDEIKASFIMLAPLVNKFGEAKLAEVFLRFKNIFLAFKKCHRNNSYTINSLRRLAVKAHKPMKDSLFNTLVADVVAGKNDVFIALNKALPSLNNYRKVQILQAIKVRLKEPGIAAYVIRNQKLWVDNATKPTMSLTSTQKAHLDSAWKMIYDSLVDSLKSKTCKINIPVGLNLTLPVSEKSFSGNYPLGTSFDLGGKDLIVGIHWRGDEGARDLDLRMHDIDGKVYGWNSHFTNAANSVVFSGDMTTADPEATELFYCKSGEFRPCIIKVNLFSGEPDSKFRFFIAHENVKTGYPRKNYMVDPNNIKFTVESTMDDREKSIGVITGDKFVITQFRTGKGRVSYVSVTDLYTHYALKTLDCYVDMRSVLTDAGFIMTDQAPDIDLSNLQKDTLIDLLS